MEPGNSQGDGSVAAAAVGSTAAPATADAKKPGGGGGGGGGGEISPDDPRWARRGMEDYDTFHQKYPFDVYFFSNFRARTRPHDDSDSDHWLCPNADLATCPFGPNLYNNYRQSQCLSCGWLKPNPFGAGIVSAVGTDPTPRQVIPRKPRAVLPTPDKVPAEAVSKSISAHTFMKRSVDTVIATRGGDAPLFPRELTALIVSYLLGEYEQLIRCGYAECCIRRHPKIVPGSVLSVLAGVESRHQASYDKKTTSYQADDGSADGVERTFDAADCDISEWFFLRIEAVMDEIGTVHTAPPFPVLSASSADGKHPKSKSAAPQQQQQLPVVPMRPPPPPNTPDIIQIVDKQGGGKPITPQPPSWWERLCCCGGDGANTNTKPSIEFASGSSTGADVPAPMAVPVTGVVLREPMIYISRAELINDSELLSASGALSVTAEAIVHYREDPYVRVALCCRNNSG